MALNCGTVPPPALEALHFHDFRGGDGSIGIDYPDEGNPDSLDNPRAVRQLINRAEAPDEDLTDDTPRCD